MEPLARYEKLIASRNKKVAEGKSLYNIGMRDITLMDSHGKYLGTVRTTDGKDQPSQVEYEGRLFTQSKVVDTIYIEVVDTLRRKDCFNIPKHYYTGRIVKS